VDLTFEFHELRFQDGFVSFERSIKFLLGGAVIWTGVLFAGTGKQDARETALVFVGLVVVLSGCVYWLNSSFVMGFAGWDARRRLESVAATLFLVLMAGLLFMQHTAHYPIQGVLGSAGIDGTGSALRIVDPIMADCTGAFLPVAILSISTSVLVPFSPLMQTFLQLLLMGMSVATMLLVTSIGAVECIRPTVDGMHPIALAVVSMTFLTAVIIFISLLRERE